MATDDEGWALAAPAESSPNDLGQSVSSRHSARRHTATRLVEAQRTADEARRDSAAGPRSASHLATVSYLPGSQVSGGAPATLAETASAGSAAKTREPAAAAPVIQGSVAPSWSVSFGLSNSASEDSGAEDSASEDSGAEDSASEDSGAEVSVSADSGAERPYVAPRFRRGVRIDDDSADFLHRGDDSRAGSNSGGGASGDGAAVDPRRAAREKAAEKRANRAANVSIAALTRRGLSRWELGNTLTSRGVDAHEVETELDRLEAVGLIDDAALADTLVRTQHDRKGLGRSALVSELRRRHIDQHHIDAAMEQLDVDDELIRATELAVRRAPQLRSLDPETAKRRLNAFLMRKGYSSGIVRAAVDVALSSGSRTVRFD